MNIDMNINYDALLEKAKKEYLKVRKLANKARNSLKNDDHDEYMDATKRWIKWIEDNIESYGVKLMLDLKDGAPVGIHAIISGRSIFT